MRIYAAKRFYTICNSALDVNALCVHFHKPARTYTNTHTVEESSKCIRQAPEIKWEELKYIYFFCSVRLKHKSDLALALSLDMCDR